MQKSVNQVINEELEGDLNNLVKKLKKLEGQEFTQIVKNVSDKTVKYIKNSTLDSLSNDAKNVLNAIVDDAKLGAAQLTSTMDLTPEQIASVYNISVEDATLVKNTILFSAGTAFAGSIIKKGGKGTLDLAVDDTNKLEVGQVDTYKNLKKTTGDGTVDRDHIPSKEALKKRAEEIKGERLDKTEEKRIENESQAITVNKEVHKEASTTGSNNKVLSKKDAKDLENAVKRDTAERIESTKKLDPENLKKIEEGCAKIGGCTNEQYDEFLKKILSGE